MEQARKIFIVAAILLSVIGNISVAQSVRDRIFSKVDQLKREAEARNAKLLSPNFYSEALEYFNDAEEGLKEGDELNDIKELISNSENYFRKSIEYSVKAADKFHNVLKAREDCLKFGADTLAADIWKNGEDTFRDAMDEFEEDSYEDAVEYAFEAEKIYRQAELNAIKEIVCGPTWELLRKAEKEDVEDFAPITLKEAQQLIYNAEKELEEKRYDNEYAGQLANDAHSEILHALNITSYLKDVKENDKSEEEIILYYEEPLKAIAEELGIKPKFEDGYTSLVSEISSKLKANKSYEDKYRELEKAFKELQEKYENSKREYNAVANELKRYKTSELKFNEIKNSFKAGEAEVFKLNDKIIIRLKKLQFSTGSSVISPRYFGLLSKVLKALEKYSQSKIIVAAHTDASGKAKKNLLISQRRADAIYQYLLANSNIGKNRLSAIGYGEQKPIASNETNEGRARNRRIEIIIQPMKH